MLQCSDKNLMIKTFRESSNYKKHFVGNYYFSRWFFVYVFISLQGDLDYSKSNTQIFYLGGN